MSVANLKFSLLGLGTVKFGRNQAVKYPQAFSLPTDQEICQILELCQELGINTLDTAPAYGSSEERLGKLLPGKREDWILISKFGEEFCAGTSNYDFSPARLTQSVEQSLRRLRTDHLDVLLLHSDGNDLEILAQEELLIKLAELKKRGLIRAAGISTKTLAGGLHALSLLDTVMISFNQFHYENLPILELAAQLAKPILIKKAFDSGHAAHNFHEIQTNLEFIAQHKAVASIIIGTINPQHLRENARALAKYF